MSEPSPVEKRRNASGIQQLERYRKAKEALEEQDQRAKAYLEMTRANVEQDLAPLREEVEAARASIEAFVREENGGEKYKVPGLGTAYLSSRRQTKVLDLQAFLEAVHDYTGGQVEQLYDDPKPNSAACKKYAESWLSDEGELLPGVESEEVQTLNVRLGG